MPSNMQTFNLQVEQRFPDGTVETSAYGMRDRSRYDLFLQLIAIYGLCIGKKVDEHGNTAQWIFAKCKKNEKECLIPVITTVELV